jgi:phosphohistidine phosphatase SixA
MSVQSRIENYPAKGHSMKRVFRFLTVLITLLIPMLPMAAQDSDVCSAENIANRIGEVYNAYTEQPSSDLETSLDGMDSLESQLNAIYSECDEARYQAYVEEGTALLEDLREGGYVIYMRHARTDRSQEDTDLASCETQRNLSEQGRSDATNIGAVWSTLNIAVGDLISTEYCRTHETAQMVFGEPTVIPYAELETTLDEWFAISPAEGTNTVIVGHVDLLEGVTGIQIPEEVRFNEGDALIYRPLGGAMGDQGYELMTRISFRNWFDLARIVAETEQE